MYFCKNCGEQYASDEAVICVKCGVMRKSGKNYCHNCGNALKEDDIVCYACGVSAIIEDTTGTAQETVVEGPAKKSKILAGILGIFFGCFGVHNFYLGYNTKAVVQLVLSILGLVLSCVFVGIFLFLGIYIWSFIEGILILIGNIKTDAAGNPLGD